MTDSPTNNGKKSGDGRFQSGNPGGPGRPAGSRNKATLALDDIASEKGEAILRKMVEAAEGGDMRASELVLSRLWPARKGRLVSIELPKIESASDVVLAMGAVVEAAAAGDITPDEGTQLASILDLKRKSLETADLESRISALEKDRKP